MSEKRTWFIAAVLMLVAAAASAVSGSWQIAALLAVAGVLFLVTPRWQESRKRR